jgi:hypothetical protein
MAESKYGKYIITDYRDKTLKMFSANISNRG